MAVPKKRASSRIKKLKLISLSNKIDKNKFNNFKYAFRVKKLTKFGGIKSFLV